MPCLLALITACDGAAARFLLTGETPDDPDAPPAVAVAVAQPSTNANALLGSTTTIRWADVAEDAGTVVSVVAQRRNNLDEATGPEIPLVTDRDALQDGDADEFEWEVEGILVGSYAITATITAPDGTTSTAEGAGRINVTTNLPVPTLTFTNPGAANITLNSGGTLTLTWTDNGSANADARLTLGLDLDFEHTEGDEIILLSDQLLSTGGNAGSFDFTGVDENGNTVANNASILFAVIDDGAHDPVSVTATGRVIVAQ